MFCALGEEAETDHTVHLIGWSVDTVVLVPVEAGMDFFQLFRVCFYSYSSLAVSPAC